jgi:hypothetical protein
MFTAVSAFLHKHLKRGSGSKQQTAAAAAGAAAAARASGAAVNTSQQQLVGEAELSEGCLRTELIPWADSSADSPGAVTRRPPLSAAAPPPADFICASPLLPSCGISGAQVAAEVGTWVDLGNKIISNLGLPALAQLTAEQK